MTLNPSTMRLGIASILVGLVGAYGVRVMMEEDEVAAVTEDPEKFTVPIASADLPIGRILTKGDIALVPMTMKEVGERGWNSNDMMMVVDQIVGREVKQPISARQPIRTSDVFLDAIRSKIPPRPGMRGVQIRVTEDRGGLSVNRGETVDVFFTSEPQQARDGKPAIPERTLKVADAVRVLNIEVPQLSDIRWAVGYKAKAPILTVEVEPDVAGKITTLRDYGLFAVMARSGDESTGAAGAEGEYSIKDLLGIQDPIPAPPPPPVVGVEYFKRGSRFMKYFPASEEVAQQQRLEWARQNGLIETDESDESQRPTSAPPEAPPDVLPEVPTPRPQAAQYRPAPRAQVPYRPDPVSSAPPPAPPRIAPPQPPASGAAATSNTANSDPFIDDGEVLP